MADVIKNRFDKEELIEIRENTEMSVTRTEDVSIEDLIADENVVITISHAGYIKPNLTEYKHKIEEELVKSAGQEIKIS
jgi:DNA gyrase subunit A